MVYKVKTSESANGDAFEYVQFILDRERSSSRADVWFDGLMNSLEELANDPRRHRRIDEASAFPIELRQKLYHSHRIIFAIDDETGTVNVLRIYHQSRKPLRRKMIP